ncbi:MAG: anthranilate phosphoribosyltransferase [Actinomycetota bacterium]|jgi:anthranilate phosphoribosyltransferase|nr:anthranilate phosphoribosyltransferase [Actinomycetota bacterium]
MTWPAIFTALLARQNLGATESTWAMDQIMSGEASSVQVAGFLMALRAKGETVDEMRGLADTMLAHATRVDVGGTTLDVVGTGGDRAQTVNISTMAALVSAASGVRVVKHGNRASSSSSGSADVLEALGVNLTLSPSDVAAVAERAGITFCFAQQFHPSMRHAAEARRDLGIGTAFNFLGPLTNPAQPTYAAVGVADARMAPLMAGVFADRGKDAAVFRGDDGLDELTISTTSRIWWVRSGVVREFSLDPESVGLQRHPVETLRGADATHNAQVVRDLFAGSVGPIRDAVVLNAGIALAISTPDAGESQSHFIDALKSGMDRAESAIDDGSATSLLQRWVAATRE